MGERQHGHRHEREGGGQARPAEYRLEVGVEHHEDPGRHAEHREQRHRTAGEAPLAEQPDVQQGGLLPPFPQHEAGGRADTDQEAQEGRRRGPPSFRAFVQHQDAPDHRAQGGQRADPVEGGSGRLARVRDGAQRHGEGRQDEHDRQDEEAAPAGRVHQDSRPEHPQAGDQDRLAAPAVPDRTERQQQRGHGDGVEVDHPQDLALRCGKGEGQTFSPDTDAMTAMRARHTAIRMLRRWRGSRRIGSAVGLRAGGLGDRMAFGGGFMRATGRPGRRRRVPG
jgi:hypothetical protein